jgi:hypothetical protein
MTSSVAIDWTAVGSIATALALALGIGTLYWQHQSQLKRDDHDRSKFALDSCLATYRIALERLEDGNNDRVTWITSARMIQRANELSILVTASPHIAVLEVEKELLRDRAADVIGYENPAKGDWFFRGLDEPDQDAGATGAVGGQRHRSHARRRGKSIELSFASVETVFELASFPKNYEEPLRDHGLEERVGVEMRASFPGLFGYLTTRFNRERASPGDEA